MKQSWFSKQLLRICGMERSPIVLTQSLSVGVFAGLSPYMGLHSVIVVIVSWIFRLNVAVGFVTCHVINNPWTVGPIVLSQYLLGRSIVVLCGLDGIFYNPAMVEWVLGAVRTVLPVPNICFWSFMIGSHLMAVAVTGILYPIVYRLANRVLANEALEFVAAQSADGLPNPASSSKPHGNVNERL